MVFSLLHVKNQFPGVLDNHHRVNLIAKLLREKQWRTPKGFYNHWDVGQAYKLKLEKQNETQKKLKQEELYARDTPYDISNTINYGGRSNNVSPVVNNHRLQAKLKPLRAEHCELTSLIATETRYLNDMEARCLKIPDLITQLIINSTAIKIAKLHERMALLHQQIEQYQEAA